MPDVNNDDIFQTASSSSSSLANEGIATSKEKYKKLSKSFTDGNLVSIEAMEFAVNILIKKEAEKSRLFRCFVLNRGFTQHNISKNLFNIQDAPFLDENDELARLMVFIRHAKHKKYNLRFQVLYLLGGHWSTLDIVINDDKIIIYVFDAANKQPGTNSALFTIFQHCPEAQVYCTSGGIQTAGQDCAIFSLDSAMALSHIEDFHLQLNECPADVISTETKSFFYESSGNCSGLFPGIEHETYEDNDSSSKNAAFKAWYNQVKFISIKCFPSHFGSIIKNIQPIDVYQSIFIIPEPLDTSTVVKQMDDDFKKKPDLMRHSRKFVFDYVKNHLRTLQGPLGPFLGNGGIKYKKEKIYHLMTRTIDTSLEDSELNQSRGFTALIDSLGFEANDVNILLQTILWPQHSKINAPSVSLTFFSPVPSKVVTSSSSMVIASSQMKEDPLHIKAIKEGLDFASIAELIQQLPEKERKKLSTQGQSALDIAVEKQRNDIIPLLLADTDLVSTRVNALNKATCMQATDIVRLFIEIDSQLLFEPSCNVLHYAAESGDLPTLQWLLQLGVPCNNPNINELTPLLLAIKAKQTDCAIELIKAGADVNIGAFGYTPLHDAITNELEEVALVLLTCGIGLILDAKDLNSKTPLILAIQTAQFNVAEYLIKANASLDTTYPYQGQPYTALDWVQLRMRQSSQDQDKHQAYQKLDVLIREILTPIETDHTSLICP